MVDVRSLGRTNRAFQRDVYKTRAVCKDDDDDNDASQRNLGCAEGFTLRILPINDDEKDKDAAFTKSQKKM